MTLKRFSHAFVALTLLAALALSPFQRTVWAQTSPGQTKAAAAAQTTPDDLTTRLAAIEKAIEAKRAQYHIPGVSFVIVKDDRVIYMKGFGLRDVERKLPVTPETL